MSLSQFAHNNNRTGTMAYPTYADNTGSVYPYYSSGTSVSPVQDEYAAGEVSYMNDNQRTHWQAQPSASSSYSTSYAPSSSSHSMPYPSAYTQSPHHQAVSDAYLSSPSSSSRTYAPSAPSQTSASSTPTLPNLDRAAWAPGTALYIVEHDPESAPATGPTYAQVKTEEEDYEGGFIFELASDAPPVLPLLDNMPEVPLRATHAPKEMRKLMGSFRLDPFAMHNGVKSAASQSVPLGIEVGPLRHPPVMFEWQIELAYPLAPRSPQWSPEAQGLHAFEDDDEKWEQAMDVYSDVFDDDEGMQDTDIPFQTVMTPAQAVGWTVGYSDTQSIVSTSSSPSGYPVQPLSGMFNRSSQASSSQASISRSLPSLPQPHSSALYRHTQPYPVLSPTSAVPSPPLPHPVYAQRSAPSSAQEIYYRQQQQQQQHAATSVSPPSSSMRISALMSSSSATGVPSISMRRTQLEYPQSQAQAHPHANAYASPSPTSFAGAATGPQQRYRGAGASAPEESMGWYRRPAFALEPYITSACT